MIRVRDRSTVMASDSVRLMKLLRSLYSVRVILGLGLQFDPNDLLTIASTFIILTNQTRKCLVGTLHRQIWHPEGRGDNTNLYRNT